MLTNGFPLFTCVGKLFYPSSVCRQKCCMQCEGWLLQVRFASIKFDRDIIIMAGFTAKLAFCNLYGNNGSLTA
jgi:hypothetical protein